MHSFGEENSLDLVQSSVENAESWLAQFSPLIDDAGLLGPAQLRSRLKVVDSLQESANMVRGDLARVAGPDQAELQQTLEAAIGQLPSIEESLKRDLAIAAPGDPQAAVDLDRLRDKLAERAARQEVGLPTGSLDEPVEAKTGEVNFLGALFMGVFGLGWTAFTTVHAILMIGGLSKAIGAGAFALLLFYSIFFLVGFGMLAGAWASLWSEEVSLDGGTFIIRRKLGAWVKEKKILLGPESKFELTTFSQNMSTAGRPSGGARLVVTDQAKKRHLFALNMNASQRSTLLIRLNRYLEAQKLA